MTDLSVILLKVTRKFGIPILMLTNKFIRIVSYPLSCIVLFLAFFFSQDCSASPNEGTLLRAPVFSKNQSIFSFNRLSVGNDFLDRNSKQILVMPECIGSNTITKLRSFDADYESYNCNLYLEESIGKMRIGFNSGFVRTGGGIFDSLIESYHQTLGFPNGERGGTPENRYSAEGRAANGESYNVPQSNFAIIDPQLSLSVPLDFIEMFNDHFFLDISSTIPTGIGKLGINKPEIKSSILYLNKYGQKFAYSIGFSGIFHLDDKQFGAKYDPYTYGVFGSVQYLILESTSIFMQNVLSTNFESKFTGLENHYWYLDAGLRFLVRDHDLLEVVVRENPSPSAGTVDVSLILRYAISSF